MLHLIEEFRHFRFDTGFVFIAQVISILLLIYFLGKSFRELKDVHSLPALGVIYMLLSAIFILIFIGYFGTTTKDYLSWFEFNYRNYFNSKDRYVDEDRVADIQFYKFWMSIALIFVLSAFVINFSKAFSTLNSLELGVLNGEKLSELTLGNRRIFFEGLLRVIIALVFIAIEKELADWNRGGKYDFVELFRFLGWVIAALYLFLLIWYLILRKNVWSRPKFKVWRFLTPIQFAAGIVLALIYRFFSSINDENIPDWTRSFLAFVILMMVLATIIIGIVAATEILGHREKKTGTP
jgi:hypothetical protein